MHKINDNRVQFRNANVAHALAERCDVSRRSLTAARDLERYYALLADELEGLQGAGPNALTDKEMPLIVEALADTTFSIGTIPLLWAIVAKNLPEHDKLRAAGIDAGQQGGAADHILRAHGFGIERRATQVGVALERNFNQAVQTRVGKIILPAQ